jgi:hypothetical protein
MLFILMFLFSSLFQDHQGHRVNVESEARKVIRVTVEVP